jgi:phage terminase large subunit-like protein
MRGSEATTPGEELREGLAKLQSRRTSKFRQYFPETGPLRRALYVKHTAFMAAGATHRERVFLKANRVGGTETAAYELTCHLTGLYPAWWSGRRFGGPIKGWAAGQTMLTTRDIVQVALMGPTEGVAGGDWSGMIPAECVDRTSRKSGGVSLCLDQALIRHISGGMSCLEFKSYDQGEVAFMGTVQDAIWLDEEPPEAVYTECVIRTMTSNGLILATFTPLLGLTPFLQSYLTSASMPDAQGALQPAMHVFWPDRGDHAI